MLAMVEPEMLPEKPALDTRRRPGAQAPISHSAAPRRSALFAMTVR